MKRNILMVEPICYHCEESIDAALMIEDFIEEGIDIINAEKEDLPSSVRALPFEIRMVERAITPTFIKIEEDSIRKFGATEGFFGDLGLLEGLFDVELPVGKETAWFE